MAALCVLSKCLALELEELILALNCLFTQLGFLVSSCV